MGCFSWLCCVCNGQILGPGYLSFDCAACDETISGTEPATLLMPDGEHVSGEYDNYGRFGYPEGSDPWLSGMNELALDVYGWLARANVPEETDTMKFCNPLVDVDLEDADFWEMTRENARDEEERGIGIDLHFKKNKHGNTRKVKYPIKAAHTSCLTLEPNYEDHKESDSDPDQGWQQMEEEQDYEFCGHCDHYDWLEENA